MNGRGIDRSPTTSVLPTETIKFPFPGFSKFTEIFTLIDLDTSSVNLLTDRANIDQDLHASILISTITGTRLISLRFLFGPII